MHCRNCGSEIPDEAKFCTFCGTQTIKPKVQANRSFNPFEEQNQDGTQNESIVDEPLINGAAEEMPEQAHVLEVALANAETTSETPSQEGKTSDSFGNSNLKAAVTQNKKRSRRRMPMILLVALALALATSVAYAAYRVYMDVWVPYQAEQQQKTQVEKNAREAQDAYNGIIEEYSEALTASASGQLDAEEPASTNFPHVNEELMIDLELGSLYSLYSDETITYYYAVKDVNDDGIPELFIGSQSGSALAKTTIYDVWSYQNEELKRILLGMKNLTYSLRENNLILTAGRSGVNIVGFDISSLNNQALHDAENEWESTSDDWSNVASLSEDRIEYHGSSQTSNATDTVYYEEGQNGSTVKTGYCTTDQFISMRDDFLNKYPEDTSVEWKAISAK